MSKEQMKVADCPAQIDGKPIVGCCTSMNELIKWCILNAFNVESQDGIKYVAIDYEEMQSQMDYFLEKEKKQIVDAETILNYMAENKYNQTNPVLYSYVASLIKSVSKKVECQNVKLKNELPCGKGQNIA